MAFQFVPNADGSFDEGMRQTNTETGVEYIYTDGAWRPLGPSIEDQYDKLDARYVKTEGNSRFKGDLYLDPPGNGISRFRVMEGNTPHQFQITSHPYIGGQLSDSKIHITVKNAKDANDNQVPETIINFVRDPVQPHQAVNKSYVDDALEGTYDEFLPISGGTVTGELTLKQSTFSIEKNNGTQQFHIYPNGGDYFTNIYSHNGGGIRFRTSPSDDNTGYGTHIAIKSESQTIGSATHSYVTEIFYLKTPSKEHHAANKQYVDDHRAIARNGTETNPTLSTGMLYYNTTTKQLFIGD